MSSVAFDSVDNVVCSADVKATVVSTSDGSVTEQETEENAKNAENKEQSIVLQAFTKTITLYIFSILLKLAISFFVPALSKEISSIVSLPIFSVLTIIPLPNTL